jgi:hypothetical protein
MSTSGATVGREGLAPQDMEVLRRRARIRDAHVALGTELQEALEPRAEECSGPCPSYPCGRRSTTPESCPHLARSAAMNWSIIGCAMFAKSPNCASQSTSASGSATRTRTRTPVTAELAERRVVDLEAPGGVGNVLQRRVLPTGVTSLSTA